MFPLLTKNFPASALELERLLNVSFRELLIAENDPVRVVDEDYPALQHIRINLSGAAVRPDPPQPRIAKGETLAALTAESLSLTGEGISIGPVRVSVALQARDVHLHRGNDAEGEIVLSLERVKEGSVEVSTMASDLEGALAKLAQGAADKHGVSIEEVRLTLSQLGPREIEAEASVRARKMFFTTIVKLKGQLAIDEELNATFCGLKCTGEGTIGSLACGFLSPHLQELEGRRFPLMALSLGEIRLRGVRLSAGDKLTVSAEFSS